MTSISASDRSANIWGILAGSATILAGVVWGFFPINGHCGAPFIPEESSNFFTSASCSADLVGPRFGAIIVIVVGLVVLLAAIHEFLKPVDVDVDRHPGGEIGSTAVANYSLTSELSELARLHASGALSDDEYRIAKARALGTNRGD